MPCRDSFCECRGRPMCRPAAECQMRNAFRQIRTGSRLPLSLRAEGVAIRIPAMQSIARSRRERKENGLPRRFAPRNDTELLVGPSALVRAVVRAGRRGQKAPYRGKIPKRRSMPNPDRVPSSAVIASRRRGNLLERAADLYAVPGDCHVGLWPPRNFHG